MYIDKRLREHNLLQAIARVNRVAKGKQRGLTRWLKATNSFGSKPGRVGRSWSKA